MAGNRSRIATPQANLSAPPVPDAGDGADKRPTAEEIAKRPLKSYRATARGYVDGRIVEEGETFSTNADKGSWMEPLGKVSAKEARVARAMSEMQSALKDDPDLNAFSDEALEAEALRLGLTSPEGLGRKDIIAAITAAYVNEAQ